MKITVTKAGSKIVVESGIFSATVYAVSIRGKTTWQLKFREDGVRKSNSFGSEERAIEAAETLLKKQHASFKEDGNVTRDIVNALLAREEIGAARALLSKGPSALELYQVVEKYIEACKARGCSPRHTENLSYHLKKFAVEVRKPLAKVTVGDVNGFLAGVKSPKTRLNMRGSLIALGNYAKKQGWLPYAAPTAFESSDRPIVKAKEHEIFTPEELTALLRTAEAEFPQLIPWLVLGAFAGIRAAERARLSWDDIDLANKVIILGPSITKTARRRIVDISDNLAAWLAAYRGKPITPVKDPTGLYILVRALADKAGVEWKNNALRASCATFHLLRSENAGKTALQLGHSVRELETVYFRPSLRSAAEQWFAITPATTTEEERVTPCQTKSQNT